MRFFENFKDKYYIKSFKKKIHNFEIFEGYTLNCLVFSFKWIGLVYFLKPYLIYSSVWFINLKSIRPNWPKKLNPSPDKPNI